MPRRYPALPSRVEAPGGPITVVFVKGLKASDGKMLSGEYHDSTRRLLLEEDTDPRYRWSVYFHELFHAVLIDSGLAELLDEKMIEALCNASATARMREKFGSRLDLDQEI